MNTVGLGGVDIALADVLADDRTVLGLHQAVVVGVAGAAFGLLDHQLVQQLGDGLVDELAAVVGMKAVNDERKLGQHGLSAGSK